MLSRKNASLFATLVMLTGALALAGCSDKKTDAPKAEGEPKAPTSGQTPPGSSQENLDKKPVEPKKPKEKEPVAPAPKDPTPPVPPPSLAKVKPDAVYTAKNFYEEQEKNNNFLAEKHTGKVVEVVGVMKLLYYQADGSCRLFLIGDETKAFGSIVLDVSDKEMWRKALPSQAVTLRARVPNNIWELVDVKGALPPTFTAEQFIKEKTANPEQFYKTYGEKPLIISGVINKVIDYNDKGEQIIIYLDSGGGKQASIHYFPKSTNSSLSDAQKKLLKPGQKVKALGLGYENDGVTISILLEPAP